MKKVLKSAPCVQPLLQPGFLARKAPRFPVAQKGLAVATWVLIVLAFFGGLLLLLKDALLPLFPHLPHAPVSAAPLLLMGTASLAFQRLLRPRPLDLCKAVLISLAFLLWGMDQLLPLGWATTSLGDLVIVLYVLDLGWMMAGVLRARGHGLFWQEPEGGNTPPEPDMPGVQSKIRHTRRFLLTWSVTLRRCTRHALLGLWPEASPPREWVVAREEKAVRMAFVRERGKGRIDSPGI